MAQDHARLDQRRAGVLLHLTSLPGAGPCGDLGWEAHNFVHFLADCGVTVWQMLPVGPPQHGGSPYQTSSVHAGSPLLIGLDPLVQWGWLESGADGAHDEAGKLAALHDAWRHFDTVASALDRDDRAAFLATEAHWLDDYALFRVIREHQAKPWWLWPAALRDRDAAALAAARKQLAAELDYVRFEQYVFFRQWADLRAHACDRGVLLFGDMPIFVAHDSAEVWARPHDFDLNPDGSARVVAGVPPDYFSATGQRWGNPLYHWQALADSDYRFWIDRVRTQLKLFDMVRIDHFRGFESYWEIPAAAPNAIDGTWVEADGDALFARLQQEFGTLPLIAEDLGVITDAVTALRKKYCMPGMKVLQFAFEGGPENPYLPFHHGRDCVVYTGTHDNDTSLGWYESLGAGLREHIDDYLGHSSEPMPWPMIRAAFGSRADLAIVPLQDLLALDSTHRMNTPGTADGNWGWRFKWDQVAANLPARLTHLVQIYGRAPT